VGRVDPVSEVGDEALVAARELAPSGGVVVVGPTRQAAVDFASRRARVLVLDGLAQTRPLRASLALLALDAEEPWGFAAALPPHGDLCAHPSELAYLCDVVVPIVDPLGPPPRSLSELEPQRPCLPAFMSGRGATVDGDHLLSWNDLSRLRVGLLTAIARPDRLVRWLTRRGVCPEVVLSGPDHGPLSPSNVRDAAVTARAARIAFWLASPKCSVHAERVGKSALGAPIALLEHKLALSPALTARLRALAAS
jgi:tetraacyldisaccharide-1-P 4'-kinase